MRKSVCVCNNGSRFDLDLANAESSWQLGTGPAGAESYPQRPDEADCIYYLKTGFCGYGTRCRFNHPRDRAAVITLFFFLFFFLIPVSQGFGFYLQLILI